MNTEWDWEMKWRGEVKVNWDDVCSEEEEWEWMNGTLEGESSPVSL